MIRTSTRGITMANSIQELDNPQLVRYMNSAIDKHNEAVRDQAHCIPGSALYELYDVRVYDTAKLFQKAFNLAVKRGLYVVH
jgi:hypothetical protein